jgi:hypothetical protein
LWLVGSLASFLTAFYMFRAVFMTFFGSTRVSAELQHHIHEPPPSMSVVLAVLALGAVTSGFIGLPQFWRELLGVSAPFYDFLAPVLGHATMRADVPHSAEFAADAGGGGRGAGGHHAGVVPVRPQVPRWRCPGQHAPAATRCTSWSATVITSTRFTTAWWCVFWAGCQCRCCSGVWNLRSPKAA